MLSSSQFAVQAKSKKRTIAQITKDDKVMDSQEWKSTIWIEKYAPKTLTELAIQKKKLEEFLELADNPGVLVLTGPPGSGKNALLNAYASEKALKLVKYQETNTLYDEDVYGRRKEVMGGRAYYPKDVEDLISFVRKYTDIGRSRRPIKMTSFCQ